MMESVRLFLGKCENILKQFEINSIDAMVTDPPAGIAFMGKEWDKDHGGRNQWIQYMTEIFKQCLRVLKPGSHSLVWALPRTSHWTATALENAGFEVRDVINHILGSGFPKSLDIGKVVDKLQGNKRITLGNYVGPDGHERHNNLKEYNTECYGIFNTNRIKDKGNSEFEGWGTALKPACEHWILCRKPIAEKNIAENVLKWGCGGINVDGCRVELNNYDHEEYIPNRVGYKDGIKHKQPLNSKAIYNQIHSKNPCQVIKPQGRFPANVIHDGSDEVLAGFPNTISKWSKQKQNPNPKDSIFNMAGTTYNNFVGDSGSAARFFYCAKASKRDRDEGLEDFFWYKINHNSKWQRISKKEYFQLKKGDDIAKENGEKSKHIIAIGNVHETVKATSLMRYLCQLVCPLGGTVIDPFMGSGSTGKACILEGFNFIGIEDILEYFKIAEARINYIKNKKDNQYKLAI